MPATEVQEVDRGAGRALTATPSPPIPPAVAREAVRWLIALSPGESESEAAQARLHRQWQTWLAADPMHARAWQHMATVDGRLRQGLADASPGIAVRALTAPALARRRTVRLGLLITAGASGLLAARHSGPGEQAWQQMAADLATRTGERRDTRLPDGTLLALNTASAVDVRYSATGRLIVLRAGEILLQSPEGGTPDTRPLRVRTAEGTVRAIGTRFTVRQLEGATTVAVLQGAVELRPRADLDTVVRLDAGEQAMLQPDAVGPMQPLPTGAGAWQEGMLVVDDMRLDDFVAELARHRPGLLRCAPEVAGLRVSGSYPLADTDRVLMALTRSLPVQIHSRTRWWVTVERAPG